MRAIAIGLLCLLGAACQRDRTADSAPLRPGDSGWTSSSGEVSLTEGETLSFTITSERYKAWDAARQGLDGRIASKYGAILQPGSPSRRNIDRAVQYLESEPSAVESIRRAGMSVRDFVVTTVALEQEMRLASARGEIPPEPDTVPMYPSYPAYQPYPVDTSSFSTYAPIPLPPPAASAPVARQYIDTFPRPDTMPRRDSIVITRTDSARRFTIADSIARAAARRDSIARVIPPRDSVIIRRDTVVKRDTIPPTPALPKPTPSDTTRDTIPARRLRG